MERRWKVLFVAAGGASVVFLDATIVNIAFPDIAGSFPGVTRSALSWVLNAYFIVFAALLVPCGRLADVVGRRRLFLAGITLFAIASAICAASGSVGMLVAGRALQAVGGAALVPTSRAFILAAFPPERRASAIGAWAAVAALAAALGPSIGGLLIEAQSWRLVFLVNLPIGAVVIFYGRRLLTEPARPADARLPDFLGALLMIAAIGLLALGIVKAPDWGLLDARTVAAFALAVAAGAAVTWRSMREPVPIIALPLLRSRALRGANVATVLFGAAFYGMVLCNVLFLTTVWRYSLLRAGLALTPAPFTAVLFAVPAGRLADRVGHRAVAAPGALVFALGCTWYSTQIGATPDFLAEWLPGAMIAGAGVGCTLPMLNSAAVSELPPGSFAAGSAMNSVCLQIGAVLGVALLVAILGTPAPGELLDVFDHGWRLSLVGGVLTSLACLAMGPALARSPAEQDQPVEARVAATPH
jgi:NTE family protein